MIDFPVSFTSKEITPWGGMVFLKQMLDKMQFSKLVSGCKHLPVSGSNRGYAPEVILESFITSIWCGANRFMHTELTRLDPALAAYSDGKTYRHKTYSNATFPSLTRFAT